MGAGCDWLAIGWSYRGAPADEPGYEITYGEAAGGAWPGDPPPSPKTLTTTSEQIRISGLRAGTAYEIRVALTSGIRRSEWATAPILHTANGGRPEPPLAPIVRGNKGVEDCGPTVRLRLPTPPGGCNSPTEATLQYAQVQSGGAPLGSGLSWLDYDAPITSDVEVAELRANASYSFRLIAHNAAGRSHPGTSTEPVAVCEALAATTTSGSQGKTGSWMGSLAGRLFEYAVVALIVWRCAAVAEYLRRRASDAKQGGGGASYQPASTLEDDEEAVLADGNDQLCVEVHTPTSIRPVAIEISTAGVTSASQLLKQLRLVVSEVAGRALSPEELSITYEDAEGVQLTLHAGCQIDEVLAASRVVASVAGSRVVQDGQERL